MSKLINYLFDKRKKLIKSLINQTINLRSEVCYLKESRSFNASLARIRQSKIDNLNKEIQELRHEKNLTENKIFSLQMDLQAWEKSNNHHYEELKKIHQENTASDFFDTFLNQLLFKISDGEYIRNLVMELKDGKPTIANKMAVMTYILENIDKKKVESNDTTSHIR